MTVVKFRLSGETACFRKPDVNSYVYFTYGQIHKVALMGVFGAILGYGGYAECKTEKKGKGALILPEFYEKLKNIKVSIVPCISDGIFSKKVQRFNNSVGYASKEQGGNLIVKEQWLEYPKWDIYLKVETEQEQSIMKSLLNHQCVYMPYLGKNEHFASISDVEVYEDEKRAQAPTHIESLFMKTTGDLNIDMQEDDDDDEDIDEIFYFKYEEKLPVGLNPMNSQYLLESFLFSNMEVKNFTGEAYQIKDRVIAFY